MLFIIIFVIVGLALLMHLFLNHIDNEFELEIEIKDTELQKDDYLEYKLYIVNNNWIGIRYNPDNETRITYLWKENSNEKMPLSKHQGGGPFIGVGGNSKTSITSSQLPIDHLEPGTYFLQTELEYDGKYKASNIASFTIVP